MQTIQNKTKALMPADMGTSVVYVTLWSIVVLASPVDARLDVTVFNAKALPSLSGSYFIGGYSAGNPNVVGTNFAFGRILDTGTGAALPAGHLIADFKTYAKKLNLPSGAGRPGVYYCDANANTGETERLITVQVAATADIKPESQTKTVSWGEDVTLTMTTSTIAESSLKWRHNGIQKTNWDGQKSITISFAKTSDAGIYECYTDDNQRSQGLHGFMRLIVRDCPNGKWGLPDCLSSCPICYNGGICNSDTGECICPPGFKGSNCEIGCGKNKWGIECGRGCSSNNDDACRSVMLCIADPYGCSCGASYGGLDCATDCSSGTYGSGCTQTCHCTNGCDIATGACISGGTCQSGWSGTNCQVPDLCPTGFYGDLCSYECHCKDNAACDRINDLCSNGECAPGWIDVHSSGHCQQDGSPKLIEFKNTKVNPGEETHFTCKGRSNPTPQQNQMEYYLISGSPTAVMFDDIEEEADYQYTANARGVTVNIGQIYYCYINIFPFGSVSEPLSLELYALPRFADNNKPGVTVQATQATVSWQKWDSESDVGDGPVEAYLVYYKKASDDDWTSHGTITVSDPDQSSYTTDITVLDWSTSYDFTVTVKRPGLKGEGSKETLTSATTLCDVPSEGPSIKSITSTDPKELEITVEVPDTSEIKCNPDGYIENFNLKYNKTNTQEEYTELLVNDGTERTFTIDGLLAYTEYDVMVSFDNKNEQSPWSPVSTARTDEDVPSEPRNVTLRPAVTTIEVQWLIPDPVNGIITKYKIIYQETSDVNTKKEKEVTEDLSGVNTYLITNLTNDISYTVQVGAFTTPGIGPLSDEKSATTTVTIPREPTSLEVGDITDTEIQLLWTDPFPFSGDIQHYGISYTSTESVFKDTLMETRSLLVEGTKNTHTLTNLSPGTTYSINVNASTSKGFGEPSTVSSGTSFTVDISTTLPMTDVSTDVVHSETKAQVTLPGLSEDSGISEDTTLVDYIIVLEYEQTIETRRRREIDTSKLGEYDPSGPPYYITALLPVNNLPETFIIGDDGVYGGYSNVPLTTGRQYGVYYGLRSDVDGESVYHLDEDPALSFRGGGPEPTGSPIGAIVGGIVAVVVIAALAVVAVFLFRRYRPDQDKEKDSQNELHLPCQSSEKDKEFKYQNVDFDNLNSDEQARKPINTESQYANVDEISKKPNRKNGSPMTESPYATPDDIHPQVDSPPKIAKKPVMDNPPKPPQKPVIPARDNAPAPPEVASKKPSLPKKPQAIPKATLSPRDSEHVILVEELSECITRKRKNDEFKKEFKSLPAGQVKPVSDAKIPDNAKKNRFRNILAYDHSRVRLDLIEGDPHSDYINASYIDGYKKEKAYIAAQGPNNFTIDDMWRLIWQENVTIVLMATNLSENGKVKCHQYWPEKESQWYGDICVTLAGKESFADYMVRTFKVQMDNSKVRVVKQFHFTVWPDMGVPIYATAVLAILKHVKSCIPPNSGPLFVHCSAGVGRTGTFIAIDALLEMAKQEGKVDIYNFVRKSRENRMNFVQVEDQYEFIHTALMEATVAGSTAITASDFRQVFGRLLKVDRQTQTIALETEWKNLGKVSRVARDDELSVGQAPENSHKNRFPDIVPFNRYRPHLMTHIADSNSNDYINASFVSAYVEKDAFLVTQTPLPSTVVDFWRMIYDYNSYSIVALDAMNTKDTSIGMYWPEDGALQCGPFSIETVSRDVTGSIVIRTLTLTDQRGSMRTIQQFQVTGWPDNKPRPNQKGVFVELMGIVEKWQQQTGNGPITVHCINGIGRSAVYCATVSTCERIKVDQMVDVFQAVKTLRSNRPNMIESYDQYKFCYEIILDYFESFDTYANFQ